MAFSFKGNALPVLIGSLPLTDHAQAADLVWRHTPDIPLWVQLPKRPAETITRQFAAGFPGLHEAAGRVFIDTASADFEGQVLAFYEDALALQGPDADLTDSRFAMQPDAAQGLLELVRQVQVRPQPPIAVKGQIIGPVTFGTNFSDPSGKAIYYDPQLRDVAVKLLALSARWQVRQLAALGVPVLLFIDDPAMTGFGSSMYLGLTREDISQGLEEMVAAIHSEGGLAGVHVCANTDWPLILDSAADIVSFDAYTFTDQFLIYGQAIRRFLQRGGLIAWGLVPTLSAADIERETADSLLRQWSSKLAQAAALGLDREMLLAQSLITPACGMGTLSEELALKALKLTQEVSRRIREEPPETSST